MEILEISDEQMLISVKKSQSQKEIFYCWLGFSYEWVLRGETPSEQLKHYALSDCDDAPQLRLSLKDLTLHINFWNTL